MNKLALIIIGFATGAAFAFAIAIIIYTQWSSEPYSIEQIGAFGDAFGGILNPFLAVINIGVLIYISYEIAKFGRKGQEDIATREYKMAYYKEVKSKLNDLYNEWSENPLDDLLFYQLFYNFQTIKAVFKEEVKKSVFARLADETLDDIFNGFKNSKYSHRNPPDVHVVSLHLETFIGDLGLIIPKLW